METHQDQPSISIKGLATTIATPMQRRNARGFCVVLAVVVLLALPYASILLPVHVSFVAYYTAFAICGDLLTAYLLFGQFLSTRIVSLAVLATTYLFSGVILVPYSLTFPDLFSRTGLLNSGSQTTNWLWVFWHVGFSLGIILYVIANVKYRNVQLTSRRARLLFLLVLLCVIMLVFALAFIAIVFSPFLPIMVVRGDFQRINTSGLGPAMALLAFIACGATMWQSRRGTIIQNWLNVAAFAWLLDTVLNLWAERRYTLGWGIARINSVAAATVVLCSLLYEVYRLYEKNVQQTAQLEQQNVLQRNFVSTVGHEFRTALTSIQGFSEVMQVADLSAQEVKDYAGDMNHEALRLTRLISDLLDLDRMKAGRESLRIEQMDLDTLVKQVANRMRSVSAQHTLRLDLACPTCVLAGDSDKLTQVITNLVNNAIKYSPDGGEILLKSWSEEQNIHFSIQDSGMGIPPEKIEKVFDRYTRVEADSTRYIGGTGLGLSIARQIVEMHKGKIWAESPPGKGSIFHIVLPLASSN